MESLCQNGQNVPQEENQLNKLEFSAVSVAALNYLLKKQRDAIGLTLVSDHIVEHTPAKTNSAHQQLIYNHLYKVLNTQETEPLQTNLPTCIHQVAEMIHKRSLVIIFSYFLESQDKTDELFNAIQHLKHNKHEVVVFHVQSKKEEQDFEFENRPHEFIDMESGKSIKLMPNQIKEIYQEKKSNYLQELKNKFISYRIDWVVANIEDGFNDVLMTYLIKRKKMRT